MEKNSDAYKPIVEVNSLVQSSKASVRKKKLLLVMWQCTSTKKTE